MRRLAFLLLPALLAGCGLSPQRIDIQPQPKVASQNLGHNQPVAVKVVDDRDNATLGTRGGVYKDTALIRAANDVPTAIAKAVRQGLQAQGFNAYNPGQGATDLTLHLKTLEYVPESGLVVNQVKTHAVIEGVATRKNLTHKGTYRSEVTFDMPMTPSANRNRKMINEVLNRTLSRLLADPKMLSFLAGNNNPGDMVKDNGNQPQPAGGENDTGKPGPQAVVPPAKSDSAPSQ